MLAIVIVAIGGYFILNQKGLNTSNKPPIVDYFACGDYCPGPQEKYMVKVYQGITDPIECKNLGGTPSTFTGWGVTHFCKVESWKEKLGI